ncbi:DUF3139 domain-containing protein [Paenibacillus sp. WLX2291]|uniref:DUF3139 domain-containing protein n=1 Tax=Paenibacillus sp. WLX2291 TaxID=3296934 RepID=UPI0039842D8B
MKVQNQQYDRRFSQGRGGNGAPPQKMSPQSKRRLIIAAIIIALLVGTPYGYVQYNKWSYAQRVTDYLIQQEHYTQQELQSVEGFWGIMLPAFYVDVVFADEPNITYTYFAHAGVKQMQHRPTNGEIRDPIGTTPLKHLENE